MVAEKYEQLGEYVGRIQRTKPRTGHPAMTTLAMTTRGDAEPIDPVRSRDGPGGQMRATTTVSAPPLADTRREPTVSRWNPPETTHRLDSTAQGWG